MPLLIDTAVRRLSLRDQALGAIRRALISGQIEPGVVYSAASLAVELGVSTSPVREAMLALVDDGLMEALPNRGYRPVMLSPADLAEIAQLRMFLEVPAAGEAAEQELGDRLATLYELVDVIEETAAQGDLAGALEAERRFHLVVVETCDNRRLTEQVSRLWDQTRMYNLRTSAAGGAVVASAADYRPLLDAIADHNRDRAEDLMWAHLNHILTD